MSYVTPEESTAECDCYQMQAQPNAVAFAHLCFYGVDSEAYLITTLQTPMDSFTHYDGFFSSSYYVISPYSGSTLQLERLAMPRPGCSEVLDGALTVGLVRQCQTIHGRDRTCIPPRLPPEWVTTLFFIIMGIISLTVTCGLLVASHWRREATKYARWIAFTGSE
ncbi:Modulator of smoothened protein [Labeo rohita]|uniref:Modulator of smoothened protein n=1 Tax=Labeo rohita TaxID=84645 RepID=A0ABQ8L1Q0_LABRO|nr:Modulator of smoothened protein [Labeo rohita]